MREVPEEQIKAFEAYLERPAVSPLSVIVYHFLRLATSTRSFRYLRKRKLSEHALDYE